MIVFQHPYQKGNKSKYQYQVKAIAQPSDDREMVSSVAKVTTILLINSPHPLIVVKSRKKTAHGVLIPYFLLSLPSVRVFHEENQNQFCYK